MQELFDVYVTASLVILAMAGVFYYLSVWAKNGGLADVGWGLGFILISSALLYENPDPSNLQMLVHVLVSIWGARLAIHVFLRNLGKSEDWRYQKMRASWGKTYIWRSFLQINVLQGFLALLVAAPIAISTLEPSSNELSAFAYVGAAIWLVGFIFEAAGDYQLKKFVKDKKTKGQIMDKGLWAYTRHPNYFGEVTQWWGLFVAVIGAPYWGVAILGPLVISFLILKVSGIPMMERKWDDVEAFQEYKRRTNAFFPWLPRRK